MIEVNRSDMALFVETLFRYCDDGGYVALRAFDSGNKVWGEWPAPQIANSRGDVINAAIELAEAAAKSGENIVFCPPVATFKSAKTATEQDILNGPTLSIDCDEAPTRAREIIENVLGPATVTVASGGLWTDPETGGAQEKVHLHWRLTEPTRVFADHVKLKEARRLATILVGADGSAVPLVHPLRWPGSLHRKAEPRLARIVNLRDDVEIELSDALNRLHEAVAARGKSVSEADYSTHQPSEPEADFFDIAAALAAIPNDDLKWDEWNRIGMATWRATGGSDAGGAAFAAWSAKSSKNAPAETRARWDHYRTSPPTHIGAGTLFFLAAQARRDWRKPSDIANDWTAPRSGDPFEDYGNGHSPGGQQADEEEDFSDPAPPDPAAYTVQSWLDRDIPEPDLLLGPFSTTSRGLFVADTGLGKTNFAIAVAFAMAGGQPFLHWTGHRTARILFIDGEMSRRLLRGRIIDAARRAGTVPDNLYFLCRDDIESMPPLNSGAGQQFIDRVIEQIGGVDFIVFDNVQALLIGDMKDEEPWQQTLPWIRSLTRCSIGQLWVHHTGHDTGRSYGTKTREWQLDTVMLAEAAPRDGADLSFNLRFTKARERGPGNRGIFEEVEIALADDAWGYEGSAPHKTRRGITPLGQQFLNALLEATARPGAALHPAPGGRKAVTLDSWRIECRHRGLLDDEKPDSQRALFSKHRRELVSANLIGVMGELVWRI